MKKIMNWLMLSCKMATELMEKQSLVGLSAKERFRLRLHTSMCDGCTAYQKQSMLIDKMLHHHIASPNPENIPEEENRALKDRILTNLKKESERRHE
jgi:hypothetical protein